MSREEKRKFVKDEINRQIKEFRDKTGKINYSKAKDLLWSQFALLLAAPKSLEKRINFFAFDLNISEEAKTNIKERLKKMNRITDKNTAIMALSSMKFNGAGAETEQFIKCFKEENAEEKIIENFSERQKELFEKRKKFCEENFKDILLNTKFYAWDIAMAIDTARDCFLCGYLNQDEAMSYISELALKASEVYEGFEDYTIGYICGGSYYIYRMSENEDMAAEMFKKLFQEAAALFFGRDTGGFAEFKWYKMPEYFKGLKVKNVIESDTECIISNKISVEGKPVTTAYTAPNPIKEGEIWVFLSGDEDIEYLSNPDNIRAFPVNYICSYDEAAIEIIKNPDKNVVFKKDSDGKFVKEESLYIVPNPKDYDRYIVIEMKGRETLFELLKEYLNYVSIKKKKFGLKLAELKDEGLMILKCPDEFTDGYYYNFGTYLIAKYELKSFVAAINKNNKNEDYFGILDSYNMFHDTLIGAFGDKRTFHMSLNEKFSGMQQGKISLGDITIEEYLGRYNLDRNKFKLFEYEDIGF